MSSILRAIPIAGKIAPDNNALNASRNARAREQERIVAELQRMGVALGYEHEWDDERDCFSGAPIPGSILRSFLGDHFFLRPSLVLASECDRDATALNCVTRLSGITACAVVDSPKIDDSVIDIMLGLPRLEESSLYGTSVTTDGVARLSKHRNLKSTCVSHTNVKERDLAHLRRIMPGCAIHWDDEPNVPISEILGMADDATEQKDEREPE